MALFLRFDKNKKRNKTINMKKKQKTQKDHHQGLSGFWFMDDDDLLTH